MARDHLTFLLLAAAGCPARSRPVSLQQHAVPGGRRWALAVQVPVAGTAGLAGTRTVGYTVATGR